MSRAAEGTEDKGASVKEVLDDNVCNAEEIVAHSKLTASPRSLLQLMYKLGLFLVLRTSIMSLLNWLLTISTSSTVSTLIDPEAVLLNTESMREVSILHDEARRMNAGECCLVYQDLTSTGAGDLK